MKFIDLEKVFNKGKVNECTYIAIVVEMEGFNKPELIVNFMENVDQKIDYYHKTYDENLIHKHAPGIKIIGAMTANNLELIEYEYMYRSYINTLESKRVKE